MTGLVEFLRARLRDDEALARVIVDGDYWHGIHVDTATEVAVHIERHDPARVLREVEAKRRILNAYTAQVAERQRIGVLHDAELATGGEDSLDVAELMGKGIAVNSWINHLGWVLRVLATAYAEHPDYQDEWRV